MSIYGLDNCVALKLHYYLLCSYADAKLQRTGKFKEAFRNENITSVLGQLVESREYRDWKVIRNILIHRLSHGRDIYIGGPNDGRSLWLNKYPISENRMLNGIPIDQNLTSSRRNWLSNSLSNVLVKSVEFFKDEF